jgi:hypothetical protein
MVRGDSVFFFEVVTNDSAAWVFDRRHRTFARVPHAQLPFDPRASYDISDIALHDERFTLVDSMELASADVGRDIGWSNVLRWRSSTIALRRPRIAAERRWRVTRGLSVNPRAVAQETEEYPRWRPAVSDWGPVRVATFAVDSQALWLGLQYEPDLFRDFALGGLLRVDRRSHAVAVVTDSLLMHSTVAALLPWRHGYLVLLGPGDTNSGALAFFDPTSRHARRIKLPPDLSPTGVALSGDTAWVAAGGDIAVLNLANGGIARRGFRLAVHGDSVTYDLADRTRPPSLALGAAVALAGELGVPDVAALVRAANQVLRVDGFVVYNEDSRFPMTVDRDTSAGADSAMFEQATGLVLGGLESPVLRPFLHEATRIARSRRLDFIANVFVEAHDTAAVPALRAALDLMDRSDSLDVYPFDGAEAAPIATALAWLGDSTGIHWARTALGVAKPAEIRRELMNHKRTAGLENGAYDVAVRLRDPVVMASLAARVQDTTVQYWVVARLLDYETDSAWRAAMVNLWSHTTDATLDLVFRRTAQDSSGLANEPFVRDSTRALARRVFESGRHLVMGVAGTVLARYGNVDDIPSIIGGIERDSTAYEEAVLTLVRITGEGVDAMPRGVGTRATRTAAAQWWHQWYDVHRESFRPATRQEGFLAWERMLSKIHSG